MEEDRIVQDSAFLNLPEPILEKIFRYLSYDEIAQTRIVCVKINEINKCLLNNGFRSVDRFHTKYLKEVKSQLPRRESLRIHHPLARRCNILSSIGTRVSLLSTTFHKYVDRGLCCFIPGKVIDEIYRVLRVIKNEDPKELKAYEVITELRDISSMAMEHFEEKIIPLLKPSLPANITPRGSFSQPQLYSSNEAFPGTSALTSNIKSLIGLSPEQLQRIYITNKLNKNNINKMRKETFDLDTKVSRLNRKVIDQDLIINDQIRTIAELSTKLSHQDRRINEVNRKLAEYEQRFTDLMTGLGRSKDDKDLNDNTYNSLYSSQGQAMFFTNVMQPSIMPFPMYSAPYMMPNYSTMGASSSGHDGSNLPSTSKAGTYDDDLSDSNDGSPSKPIKRMCETAYDLFKKKKKKRF